LRSGNAYGDGVWDVELDVCVTRVVEQPHTRAFHIHRKAPVIGNAVKLYTAGLNRRRSGGICTRAILACERCLLADKRTGRRSRRRRRWRRRRSTTETDYANDLISTTKGREKKISGNRVNERTFDPVETLNEGLLVGDDRISVRIQRKCYNLARIKLSDEYTEGLKRR